MNKRKKGRIYLNFHVHCRLEGADKEADSECYCTTDECPLAWHWRIEGILNSLCLVEWGRRYKTKAAALRAAKRAAKLLDIEVEAL